MTTSHKNRSRKLTGIVLSDKMDKTVVVRVDRVKTHPVYKKQFHVSTTFKAHDETNQYKAGDHVIIQETRPLSRDKRWRVIGKLGATKEATV